ncbi:hypothetical protein Q1695_001959 [Nippostrongylus brasiliensis]|nr:hypothetical protein Q1695_001959 [Nippostrongylus brasiliensis]
MFRVYSGRRMSGSSLLQALDKSDRAETERLLEVRPEEVSVRDGDDRVALHYAAETMDLPTFEKILERDLTLLDCEDRNGHTPFLMAVMGGRVDLVELLLSKGAQLNHRDRDGHTAVHWAVVCGQLDMLNYLISQGADVEAPDLLKAAPLHYATATEEINTELALAILHTLLKAGAKPNCRDMDDRTPILWAASNGNLEAMHSLKQAGGDLQAVDRDRLSVLHCSASHGYHETIDFFMDAAPHSAVDQKDRSGHSALFYAVTYGHFEAAKHLLDFGASPNHQDHRLRTPSHCAAAKGQMRMLKLLKQYNASFEIQNYRGDLPVHEAVQAGSRDVVEWLLALQPSSINAASHEGRTCLHLAAAQGNIEMVVLLCTKGCFVNPLMLYKKNLYTPLDLARRKNHQVVVDYLSTKHEAKPAEEIPNDEQEKYRLTFEEQLVQAKLARGRRLLDEDEENEDLMRKSKAKRRRSFDDNDSHREMRSTGVNTSIRRISSASQPALPKSTSTTDLTADAKLKSDEQIEQIIREEIQRVVSTKKRLVDNTRNKENEHGHDASTASLSTVPVTGDDRRLEDYSEEEFEDLPAISDTSDEEDEAIEQRHQTVLKEKPEKKAKTKSDTAKKAGKKSSSKKTQVRSVEGKLVRISGKGSEDEEADEENDREIIWVKRLTDKDADVGDFEVFEDDWEELNANRPTGKDASRRYIHEKSIFQELTHLKRMQIQYGKVQERILVRSLVSNFCKMHGLDPSRFKFQTFYSWEKFLYDQLKLIYMEERARLSQARTAPSTRVSTAGRFETRMRQARAVPLVNERVQRMSRVYGNSTMTSGKTLAKKKSDQTAVVTEGGKRCECLGRHLFIKQQ